MYIIGEQREKEKSTLFFSEERIEQLLLFNLEETQMASESSL